MLLELAREVAAVMIAQAVSGLVHVAAVAEELGGPLHSEPLEPAVRGLAHHCQKEHLQCPDRDATELGQCLDGISCLIGELRPVLDALQGGVVHTGSFKVMSILQWGQGIFSPMAWVGNSMCPLQKKQTVFSRSGRRRVTVVLHCGQGICWPRFWAAKRI